MKLSILIVNYNVRHFLEQCLASVEKAIQNIDAEIIVVDNASVDDSVQMMKDQFPLVKVIASKINLGFAKANNLGAKQASGEFILALNPDTVVDEDCFEKCIQFISSHPDAGAIGVKMMDGSGTFLPESKRGFPDFWAAFCKMSGLYKLLPKSAFLNGYYQGHLSENESHPVPVLSGAFMMIRKTVWEKLNGFDEDFFMYGEDIDLSYRIEQLAYKNYYFADTTIIHYKGESTSKGSLNYVVAFYKAMILFAKKHFNKSSRWALVAMLTLILWGQAAWSLFRNYFSTIKWMLLDAACLSLGFYLIRRYWATYYHGDRNYFNDHAIIINAILFVVIWIGSFYFQGVYEKKYSLKDLLIGAIWGFIFNLSLYALFPENWRSSRMLLVLSFLWVILYAVSSRLLYNRAQRKSWIIGTTKGLRILVIGDQEELDKVQFLLKGAATTNTYLLLTSQTVSSMLMEQWQDYLRINQIQQIIFCQKKMEWKQILNIMSHMKDQLSYKILTASGSEIISSPSKNYPGEIVSLELEFNLSQSVYLRQKRLFDVGFSILLFLFSWLIIFLYDHKKQFVVNLFRVLLAKKSWVSYQRDGQQMDNLPIIKPGILYPVHYDERMLIKELESQLLSMYAWNYSIWTDLDICLRNFQKLDQSNYGSTD